MGKEKLTQERLKELLNYDSQTGIFTWKINRPNVKKGDVAGTVNRGYVEISIDNKGYRANRLAWLYVEGYFPENIIDHKNRVRSDNCFQNLREVSNSCNVKNSGLWTSNKTGVKGVSWHKSKKTWQAYIQNNGKKVYLGRFIDFSDAVNARKEAEAKYNYSLCDAFSTAENYLNNKEKENMLLNRKESFSLA